jgi:hypothetical protein
MNRVKNNKKKRKKTLKFITIMLAAVTVIIWLVLLMIKFFINGVEFSDLLDDIIANILGILPPIIIFNFAYEYFTKDYVSDEISERMIETLTGNPEMMDTFEKDIRKRFIKKTIESLVNNSQVDKERSEMVYDVIEPYIKENAYHIRKNFLYEINLRKYTPDDIGYGIFPSEHYYVVEELISYKKILSSIPKPISEFKIGFFVEVEELEKELRGQKYLFRESLKIREEELEKLKSYTDQEKITFITECLNLQVLIDDRETTISQVSFGHYGRAFGISVDLISKTPIVANEFKVEIAFSMPQLKKRSELLVSIPEPTFSPTIRFKYIPAVSKITTYDFLKNEIKPVDSIKGRININSEGWIYPVKGVIFIIEDNEDGAIN